MIDLTGRADARLSYWRWFANRDLGEDSGDFFRVQVSSNGGGSWVTVENLDTNQSAAAWTRREVRIEDFVALTSQWWLLLVGAASIAAAAAFGCVFACAGVRRAMS